MLLIMSMSLYGEKKKIKKQIQKVFVEERMRTSARKYPEGFDINKYFKDRIETKHTKIDAIIMDKNLDLQWFGINEDNQD
ncbi:hypothetical protein [Thermoactinomyces mirandus]|nr:hypothetical protein [Thermoactinomyces mirandus]